MQYFKVLGPGYRRTVLLSSGVLVGLCFLVLAHAGKESLEQAVAEAERRAVVDAKTAAVMLLEKAQADPKAAQERVARIGGLLGARVSYIVGGWVKADSGASLDEISTLDDHSTRPEIVQALETGQGVSRRRSSTLGKELVYGAVRFEGGAGLSPGVVRVSRDIGVVVESLVERRAVLQYVAIPLLLAALAAVLAPALALSRALNAAGREARTIAAGDYERRLGETFGDEFGALGKAFDQLAKRCRRAGKTESDLNDLNEAVFAVGTEALFVFDAHGVVVQTGRAVDGLFGPSDALLGKTALEVFGDLTTAERLDRLREKAPAGTAFVWEDEGKAYSLSAVSKLNRKGEAFLVCAVSECSELVRSRTAIRGLVQDAAHLLRSPLTVIRGWAESLLEFVEGDRLDPPSIQKAAGAIRQAALRMETAVDGLTAAAAARRQIGAASQNLLAVLKAAFERVRSRSDAEPPEPHFDVDPELRLGGPFETLEWLFAAWLREAGHAQVRIQAEQRSGEVVVSIERDGPALGERGRSASPAGEAGHLVQAMLDELGVRMETLSPVNARELSGVRIETFWPSA